MSFSQTQVGENCSNNIDTNNVIRKLKKLLPILYFYFFIINLKFRNNEKASIGRFYFNQCPTIWPK
jgi:hypothetical protein